ncbi:MAG: replicative DNA helicase, partial [Candidatus Dormibacteraeota bacterium]|nr:replicative DNA helicase [Candidatus Dormibacteraeota bacterium]
VLALSQLSRESERRENKRPQLSDLRDSGCLVGSTPVLLPGSGCTRSIESLAGESGFEILALNEATFRFEPQAVARVFRTGHHPVFDLRTRSGRSIRATANHKFFTVDGWRRLDRLTPSLRIVAPGERGTAGAAGCWAEIASISPAGSEDVFDLTVGGGLHNFVAGDLVVHNSIEQDADVVLFLYREGLHNREVDRAKTDLIVAKNRNGPVDDLKLVFIDSQTAFREPYMDSD